MPPLSRRRLLAAAPAALVAPPRPIPPALSLVATFDGQVGGVAVARASGRVFVSFPRWEQDVAVCVAELSPAGVPTPFPDPAWNSWSNAKRPSPLVNLVCVQSLTVDAQGALWILDGGAPAQGFVVPSAPKLLKVDLSNNRVVLVLRLDVTAVPQGAALADIRVTPDGAHAFITDAGLRGALLVIDVPSGKVRRLLDGDARTAAEPGVVPQADSHDLRRPDNRPLGGGASGLAIDAAGQWLYWQALAGRTLYRAPVAALTDAGLPAARLSGVVERVGPGPVASALWMDPAGTLMLTDPADNAVQARAPDGTLTTLVKDERLRWPAALAGGADGALYIAASHLPDMAQFHPGSTAHGTTLWRLAPPGPSLPGAKGPR